MANLRKQAKETTTKTKKTVVKSSRTLIRSCKNGWAKLTKTITSSTRPRMHTIRLG
ncbi:uncharacterized protein G2W53_016701 [Senna tora]|uniref:Uncharacterized protein n=1 Tax=Senna tora TaxID=362788 RepID=A0A834TQP1_9FABA|nr:uncharacterized protein G2W53_016701 [Senna tora]